MSNKEEIQNFIHRLDKEGERIIDILVEVQRRYQLEVQSLYKLLTKEQKEKMKEQEIKLNNIKEN